MNLASAKKYFKILGFIVLLLALLALTVFAGRTASNYFAKASVCPAQNVSTAQVAANSAVVSWETEEVTQGRVEYGTQANNLTFSAPESSSGKIHSVPLTLLTPNTVYYYVVAVGNAKCDTTGETCDQTCVPWSFTTQNITPQEEVVEEIPTPTATPKADTSPTKPAGADSPVSPTSGPSAFCSLVKENIGATSLDEANWEKAKQYDIDGNGVINGIDIFKCQSQGK